MKELTFSKADLLKLTGAAQFACCCIAQNKSVDDFLAEFVPEAIS